MYLVGEQMIMGIPLKTESIDELVAFLVSKLPDPEKTEFITEVHEKIKCIEEMWEEDVGGFVCEKFNEWMHSELERIPITTLSGMREQLLSLLDDMISQIYEWY